MIIYILDNAYNKVDMVSDYISFIWTDRWNEYGDFEIFVPRSNRYSSIRPGTVVTMSESSTPMMIETVTGNSNTIQFKGRSLEHIAEYTYFKKPFVSHGSIERIATDLFNRATLYDNYLVTFDRNLDLSIFSIVLGSEGSTRTSYETDDSSVFEQFKSLLDSTYAGYSITRTTGQYAWWKIHVDKLRKNDNAALSTALSDFEFFEVVKSISSYRNRAYVRYIDANDREQYLHVTNNQFGAITNLPWEYSSRMVLVDATNINVEDFNNNDDFINAVRIRGVIELSKYRYRHAFDGKLNPNMRHKFGVDYKLGDIIPVFHENQKYSAIVKEYIWSATKDSVENYPTLEFIN